jgi:hypothetical protein
VYVTCPDGAMTSLQFAVSAKLTPFQQPIRDGSGEETSPLFVEPLMRLALHRKVNPPLPDTLTV